MADIEPTRPVVTSRLNQEVAVIEVDSPPVNALGFAVRRGLETQLKASIADPGVAAIIILCAGRTFFAGADIGEFGMPMAAPDLNALFVIIEASPKPVISAIHGMALGGGFEVALASHYRIAAASAKVGLPEVLLGLIPGAGGTQRTPRLAGVEMALELMIGGQALDARAALSAGLIDEIVEEGSLETGALAYVRALLGRGAPLRRVRDLKPDRDADSARAVMTNYIAAHSSVFRGFKAPSFVIKAVEAAVTLDFDSALACEQTLFNEAMATLESKAQRHIFFAERAVAKVPGLLADAQPEPVSVVAVLGEGEQAKRIANAFERAGLRVNRHAGDHSDQEATGLGWGLSSAVSAADLIMVVADPGTAAHHAILAAVDLAAPEEAIIALSSGFGELDGVAGATRRPERVIGLNLVGSGACARVLEVARGRVTADSVVATAMLLGRKLGLVAVLSRAQRGLICDRILGKITETVGGLLSQGVPSCAIGKALSDFGFPVGFLATLSLPDSAAAEIAVNGEVRSGDGDIVKRILFPAVNEAAKLVEEGAAQRASDVDVALVYGGGWPVFTGGPLFWADQVGLSQVLASLQSSPTEDVSPLLRRLAAGGDTFIR